MSTGPSVTSPMSFLTRRFHSLAPRTLSTQTRQGSPSGYPLGVALWVARRQPLPVAPLVTVSVAQGRPRAPDPSGFEFPLLPAGIHPPLSCIQRLAHSPSPTPPGLALAVPRRHASPTRRRRRMPVTRVLRASQPLALSFQTSPSVVPAGNVV
jgi:hypothetical protein